jgi:hypothetical protein
MSIAELGYLEIVKHLNYEGGYLFALECMDITARGGHFKTVVDRYLGVAVYSDIEISVVGSDSSVTINSNVRITVVDTKQK